MTTRNRFAHFMMAGSIAVGLLLSGCTGSGSQHHQHIGSSTATAEAQLPINADHWTTWQCADGQKLNTRYADRSGRALRLDSTTVGTHTLTREASRNPVIYSDGNLSFSSNGQYAAIGKALSDEVITGGCTVQ